MTVLIGTPADARKRLVEASKTWTHGQSLTHEEICNIAGVDYRAMRIFESIRKLYYEIVAGARKLIRAESKMELRSVRGFGYHIPLPIDHLKICDEHNLRAIWEMQKGLDIAKNIDVSKLTPGEIPVWKNYISLQDNFIALLTESSEHLRKRTTSDIAVGQAMREAATALAQVAVTGAKLN